MYLPIRIIGLSEFKTFLQHRNSTKVKRRVYGRNRLWRLVGLLMLERQGRMEKANEELTRFSLMAHVHDTKGVNQPLGGLNQLTLS